MSKINTSSNRSFPPSFLYSLDLVRSTFLTVLLTCLAGTLRAQQTEQQEGHKTAEQAQPKRYHFSQPHLGSFVQLVYFTTSETKARELSDLCFKRVKQLEAIFSDYQADSEVSKLCAKPINHPHQVSPDLLTVLAQAQKISRLSAGAFDVTVGAQTKRWRQQRQQQQQKAEPNKSNTADEKGGTTANYNDLILNPSKNTVTLRKPLAIDLGAIAKGYIADQLMTLIKDHQISSAVVNVGGEMVLGAAPPNKPGWRVGMENPELKNIGIVNLSHIALSTSGDSYQFFETNGIRSAHLINPIKQQAKSNRLNVTTLAPNAMQADAWATALRILPTEKALTLVNQQADIKALFIPFKKPAIYSTGFPKLEPVETK